MQRQGSRWGGLGRNSPRRQEEHETNPLMPGNQSQDTDGVIQHTSSLYTFMLFMPPLARKTHGHFWTPEVPLAFALFAMSVTLQLCLTLIAGASIVQQQHEAQATLIQDETIHDSYLYVMSDQLAYLSERGLDLAPKVRSELMGHTWAKDVVATQKLEPEYLPEEAEGKNWCCIGSACAGYRQCCPTANLAYQLDNNTSKGGWGEHSQPARGLSALLRKPGGGKSAKAHDTSEHSYEGHTKRNSVCTNADGIMSCMPPTSALLGAWGELDVNDDGLWSLEEATADPANFGCHVGVHMEDVFRALCRGIVRDADDAAASGIYTRPVPKSVRLRTAIPRAYFEWWRGLVAVCVNTDSTMCGELIMRGTFDGALSKQNNGTRGGMVDLDTALAYCERLLAPGGICDSALPGSYVMYRARIKDRCGVANPGSGPRHVNPHKPTDVARLMTTSWSKLDEVRNVHSQGFQFFMGLILVLWYVNLVDELKDIIHLWDLIRNFPVDEEWPFMTPTMSEKVRTLRKSLSHQVSRTMATFRDVEVPPEEEGQDTGFSSEFSTGPMGTPRSITITSFARPHQLTIIGMAMIRSVLLMYLGYSGTYFLLSNQSYIDLLLNALALAFIFELDEFLFTFLVPEATKDKLDSLAPLTYKSSLPSSGIGKLLLAKYLWGLAVIPVLSWFVVRYHDRHTTVPMMEALQCACMQVGEHCLAAAMFSKSWWDQYWAEMAMLRARGEI